VIINAWALKRALATNDMDSSGGYEPLSKAIKAGDQDRITRETEEASQTLVTQLRNIGEIRRAELFVKVYNKLKDAPNGLSVLAKSICARSRSTNEDESEDRIRPTFDDPKSAFDEILTIKT